MRQQALDDLAERVVKAGAAPAATCAVARRGNGGWELHTGAAGTLWPVATRPIHPDTPFDLASLTKPLVAVSCARAFTQGSVRPEQELKELLPELSSSPSASARLMDLLAHRAGLVPHLELFSPLREKRAFDRSEAMLRAARGRLPTVHAPTATPTYSDLGYLLVGLAVERGLGRPLEELTAQLVCEPLGIDIGSAATWLRRTSDFPNIVAPTEFQSWRGGVVHGQVHDENAWALGGHGLSGHAGAFGTCGSVARFGMAIVDALLDLPSPVEPAAARWVTRPRDGGTLRAGFDGKSEGHSMGGNLLSADAFGHLGFTGTSLWCDPRCATVTVLLTNRVCPTREHNLLRTLRPILHDGMMAWAGGQTVPAV